MRSTGIPELTCVEDTDYIRKVLALDRSEKKAERTFRHIIQKCLDLRWTVQFMWHMHTMRKGGYSSDSVINSFVCKFLIKLSLHLQFPPLIGT